MIVRKSAAEIEKMRVAGRVVAEVLRAMENAIVPGVTRTADLDRLALQISQRHGAVPAFKDYHGYPANTCISINDAVVHGIPGEQVLKNGDIVSIDFACSVDGYFADAAVTLPVGEVSPEARRLLVVTRECLFKGIAQARVGARLGDVSSAIQRHAERAGYGVVRDLVGHGVGRAMHEEPDVPNYGKSGRGERLMEGMTLAIEPMINEGGYAVEQLSDNWTIVTADGKLSAHFEHTVAITKRGPDILTLPAAVATDEASRVSVPVLARVGASEPKPEANSAPTVAVSAGKD
jgi:methionyl aminopeptidase